MGSRLGGRDMPRPEDTRIIVAAYLVLILVVVAAVRWL